jgi:Flp pilus assembly pilin Flp
MVTRTPKRRRLAATAMEYLVVASLILVALIYGVTYFGESVQQKMQDNNTALEKVSGNSSSGP